MLCEPASDKTLTPAQRKPVPTNQPAPYDLSYDLFLGTISVYGASDFSHFFNMAACPNLAKQSACIALYYRDAKPNRPCLKCR